MTLADVPPAPKLNVEVTYLEMRAPPAGPAMASPFAGVEIACVAAPTVAFYRFLYDNVGEPWLWGERRRWSDAEVAAVVRHELVELRVLYVGGQPAGYAELDRRVAGEVELAYFGILPEFIGKKLGPFLLDDALRRAWSYSPARVWVNTCTLDHPAALGVYKRAGFEVYKVVTKVEDDSRASGLFARRAGQRAG